MKKIFLILLISLLIVSGCGKTNKNDNNKKNDEIDFNIKSLDDLIDYKILDNYEFIDEYFLSDFNEKIDIPNADKIVLVKSYGSKNDDGYFSIEIFSYKGMDIQTDNNKIDVEDYKDSLVKTSSMKIDNHDFFVGYSSGDDVDDMNARAFVTYKDYVIEFTESNFDVPITKGQYDEFISMLKSVKFK